MSDSFQQLKSARQGDGAATSAPAVAPPRRLLTRVVVPGGLVLALLLVLGFASRSLWRPTLLVSVEPVLVRAGGEGAEGDAASRERETPTLGKEDHHAGHRESETPAPAKSIPHGEAVAKAAGWIEPAPYPVYVPALAAGTIEKILVLDGQPVEAGAPVCELVKADAELALRALAAEVPAKEAQVKALRQNLESDLTLAEARVDEAKSMRAQWPLEVKAMQAELDALSDRLRRMENLATSGAVVEAEVVQQRLAAQAKERSLDALRAAGPGRDARVAQAESDAARARRLREIGTAAAESELSVAKTRVSEAQLRLDRMTVRAPVAGTVMRLLKSPGDSVEMESIMPRSAQILALYDPKKLQVRVDVPLSLAAKVRVGQACAVVADILPERTFTGRVDRFVHEADLQKNTVQVKVVIDDPAPELKPEMLATAQFFAPGNASGGAGFPSAAASASGLQQVFIKSQWLTAHHESHGVVWVARPIEGGFAVAVETQLQLGGTSDDGFLRVEKGLNPGDRVVVGPLGKMKEGARLKVAD